MTHVVQSYYEKENKTGSFTVLSTALLIKISLFIHIFIGWFRSLRQFGIKISNLNQ